MTRRRLLVFGLLGLIAVLHTLGVRAWLLRSLPPEQPELKIPEPPEWNGWN